MQLLVRSLTFHLLAPYVAQLAVLTLLIRSVGADGLVGILFFGGWNALLGLALISIPFGVAHVIQAIYFAPGWPSPRTQFFVGLLNPSFAILTFIAALYLTPASILRISDPEQVSGGNGGQRR